MKTDRFKHAYTSETEYNVIEVFNNGKERIVDPDYGLYLDWIADENEPEIISGNEFITIVEGVPVEDPNKDQIILDRQWANIRAQRDAKLTDCDWTQITDSPNKGIKEWLDYRQALRDITKQDDPYNIKWPEIPED